MAAEAAAASEPRARRPRSTGVAPSRRRPPVSRGGATGGASSATRRGRRANGDRRAGCRPAGVPRGWVVVRRRTVGVAKSPLAIPMGPLRSRATADPTRARGLRHGAPAWRSAVVPDRAGVAPSSAKRSIGAMSRRAPSTRPSASRHRGRAVRRTQSADADRPSSSARRARSVSSSTRPGSKTTIVVEPRWKCPSSSPRSIGLGAS